ncbi:MAG: cupin domain-containing protein [Pseudomonadota bacterium]
MSSTAQKNDEELLAATARPFFVKADPAGAENVGGGIKRQILGYGDTLMGVRVWFETGAIGEVHSHPHAQMAYVESGQFRVTVGESVSVLSAGDSFYAPPHTDHGAVCLEAGVLIDVFSPMREDFISAADQS